jgi:type III secretion protein HrpB1
MDVLEFAKRRQFVQCLLDLVQTAISQRRVEDAEALLACVRLLRPDFHHIEFFEGWLATLKSDWRGACNLAELCLQRTDGWPYAEALLAYSKFALGDATWKVSAERVLELDDNDGARELMLLLLGRADPAEDDEAAQPPGGASAGENPSVGRNYVRA